MRQAVATNPKVTIEILFSLGAEFPQEFLKNPSISGSTLSELARERKPEVREAVAKALGTPIETLKLLANDASPGMRAEVAKNPRDR